MTTLIKECRKRRYKGESQLACCIRITKENLANPDFLRVADNDGIEKTRTQLHWLENEAETIRKQQRAERDEVSLAFIADARAIAEAITQSSKQAPSLPLGEAEASLVPPAASPTETDPSSDVPSDQPPC